MIFNFKHCCVNCNSFFEIITIINRNFKFKNKRKKKQVFKKKNMHSRQIRYHAFFNLHFHENNSQKKIEIIVM